MGFTYNQIFEKISNYKLKEPDENLLHSKEYKYLKKHINNYLFLVLLNYSYYNKILDCTNFALHKYLDNKKYKEIIFELSIFEEQKVLAIIDFEIEKKYIEPMFLPHYIFIKNYYLDKDKEDLFNYKYFMDTLYLVTKEFLEIFKVIDD